MDAEQEAAVGKLAAKIVKVIMGKHKPIYDRSQNLGDYVVVINAEKVGLTGKKREQKVYRYHTGWPGGLVTTPIETMFEKKPEEVLRRAIAGRNSSFYSPSLPLSDLPGKFSVDLISRISAGMLPKNTLRRERLKLLRIFAGTRRHTHTHTHTHNTHTHTTRTRTHTPTQHNAHIHTQ